MTFKKTGISPIDDIRCSCGASIKRGSTKCSKCGKSLLPADLQDITPVQTTKVEPTIDKSTVK